MPAVNFSPIFNGWQGFTPTGLPLSGGFIQTYQAGTSTPLVSYTTNLGNVANANPISLLADGRPPQEIWLDAAFSYKFILLDALSNQIATYDNITGIDNSAPATVSQWVVTGLTVSYVSPTTFTVAGDQTSTYQVGRRVRYTLGSGFQSGTITASVFGAFTTVTVATDSIPLDNTLSAVAVGFVTSIQSAVSPVFLTGITAPSITTSGVSTFSAGAALGNTDSASTTAIDWYDRGLSFSPGVTFGGAAVGVAYNVNRGGNAVRIGNTVFFRLRMRLTSKGSSTGAAAFTGLPYAASGTGVVESVCSVNASSMSGLTGAVIAAVTTAGTNVSLSQWGSAGTTALTDANFTNTSDVYVTGQYQVS